MPPVSLDARTVIEQMEAVRERQPLIQCLTNHVTTGFVANALLAVGAAPAMVDSAGESEIFAREAADGVLVNLGTPHPAQCDGIRAIDYGADTMPPWVLDPVAVGSLPVRTALAQELLSHSPTVIRGNASEIVALAGFGRGGRGVDSTLGTDEAATAARDLAARTHGAVAVSGPVDLIADASSTVRVANGDPMFTEITGAGAPSVRSPPRSSRSRRRPWSVRPPPRRCTPLRARRPPVMRLVPAPSPCTCWMHCGPSRPPTS